VNVVVILGREGDLLQVVRALNATRGLARLLHRWKKQGDKDPDDGNDDEELDERESSRSVPVSNVVHGALKENWEVAMSND
jgi:hypothetical protein